MSESTIITADPTQRAREELDEERRQLETQAALIVVELERLGVQVDLATMEEREAWEQLEQSGETDEALRDAWDRASFKVSGLQDEWLGRKSQLADRIRKLRELERPGEVERRARRIAQTAARIRGLRGRS